MEIIGNVTYIDNKGVNREWSAIVDGISYYAKFGIVGEELNSGNKEYCNTKEEAIEAAKSLYSLKMAVLKNGKYKSINEIKNDYIIYGNKRTNKEDS